MRIVSFPEVLQLLTLADTYNPVRESFKAYTSGLATIPRVQHLEMPYAEDGALHIKSGHIRGQQICIVKIASTFPANPSKVPPRPSIGGVIILFDVATGEPIALVEDRARVTQLRTASAGAVAARVFASQTSDTLGILGTGAQAELQAQAISAVLGTIRRIIVWGRTPARATQLVKRLRSSIPGIEVALCDTAAEVVGAAQIVVTATYAREPIVLEKWVAPPKLIIGVGADAPYKCEIDPLLLKRADLVVVDSRTQNLELGEISRGIRDELFGPDRIDAELGDLIIADDTEIATESELTRRVAVARAGGIVVVKLTGIASQDAFVCEVLAARIGLTLSTS